MFTLCQIILVAVAITLPGSAFGQSTEPPPPPVATNSTPGVQEAVVKIPEPIPDPSTAGDVFQKLPVTDQFDALRVYRNRLVYSVQTLTTQLQSVDAQLRDLLQTKKSQEERPPVPPLPFSKNYLISQQKEVNDKIDNFKQKLADPKKYKLTTEQISNLQSQIDDANSELGNLTTRIDNYDTLEKQAEQSREGSERLKKQTDASIANLRLQQTQGVDAASKLNRQLSDSDEKIANLFGRSDASNDFRKIMSAVFAGLVALVIIGVLRYSISRRECTKSNI
jgi:hypothetical protein